MHGNPQEFIDTIATPLGWFYLTAGALNLGAVVYAWRRGRGYLGPAVWGVVAGTFGVLGCLSLAGKTVVMPESVKAVCDAALGPVTLTLGSFVALLGLYLGRRFFVRTSVAWAGLNVSLCFMGLSMTDTEFAAIITRPDNVPIVAMVYLLGFFTWLAAAQAVKNDARIEQGLDPAEKEYRDTVLAWPDLVYLELIGIVIATAVLVVWSLVLRAPLEEPANPVLTPNPSKAPWYFLGLQEMLIFFDASIAGVILPCLIILGLMAIPYLDFNPKGNGYYTIKERRFAYLVFQFGFLQLWILLILIGTFMRGPNWNFFGLYEFQDPHKVLALNNVKLSEYFWVMLAGRGVPEVPSGSGMFVRLGLILWREIAGVVALSVYFIALPPLLGRTVLRDFRRRMGLGGYTIMTLLLMMMLALPLKMILRWSLNLSYVVDIPEYSFKF